MFNIVLFEPEIPSNTGNVVRTCAATGCRLHLIEPLGFSVSDRELKRAGLDYWQFADITIHKNLADFFENEKPARFWLTSTKAPNRYDKAEYRDGDYIFFGRETKGLPEDFICENLSQAIRVPMREETRSLNLSNSVAIVIYEALRQTGFAGLLDHGKFSV